MDWVRGVVERMVLDAGDVPGFPAWLAESKAHLGHLEWYAQVRPSFEDRVFAEIFENYAEASEAGDDTPWRIWDQIANGIDPDWVGEAIVIMDEFKMSMAEPGNSPPPPAVPILRLSPAVDAPWSWIPEAVAWPSSRSVSPAWG